ncbi:MAG: outer membrane beta-barrel protein [Bacteroidia bacterium]
MSEKNSIDELFRDKLDGAGLKYTSEYWEQMDALLNKKKRRSFKTAKAAGLIAALLLLLVPVVYFTTGKMEKQTTHNSQKPNISQTEKPEHEKQITTDIEITKPSHKQNTSTPELTPSGKDLIKTEVPQVDDDQTVTVQKNDVRQDEDGRTAAVQVNDVPHVEDDQTAPTQGNDVRQVEGDQTATVEINEFGQNSEKPNEALAGSSTTAGLPLVPMPTIGLVFPVVAQKEIAERITLRPSTKPKHKSPYVNIYAAPFFNYGLIRHRGDETVADWKSSREETQPYINYGLDLRLQKKRLGLLLGLGIMQWSEITNYTSQLNHYTFDTSLFMVSRNYKQRPDSSYVALIGTRIDTTSHTTTDTAYCPNCKVKFQYFTLPLAFRYEVGHGSWQYFTEVGISLSFLLKTQGEYSTQWNIVDNERNGMQTENSGKKYFTNTLIHSGLSLGVKYSPTPNLGINARLRYNRAINSMMQRYNQRPDFYGIGLGIEYRLY